MEDEVSKGNSFSDAVAPKEKSAPINGDSLSLMELQQLNMQLREMNVQIADYRTDIAVMAHRRQSALIQGIIGTTATTLGVLSLTDRHHDDSVYIPIVAGGVLCITSVITWICSYTPLANSKVKVTPKGVVYKF